MNFTWRSSHCLAVAPCVTGSVVIASRDNDCRWSSVGPAFQTDTRKRKRRRNGGREGVMMSSSFPPTLLEFSHKKTNRWYKRRHSPCPWQTPFNKVVQLPLKEGVRKLRFLNLARTGSGAALVSDSFAGSIIDTFVNYTNSPLWEGVPSSALKDVVYTIFSLLVPALFPS